MHIKVSSLVFFDHLNRLYDLWDTGNLPSGYYPHVDGRESGVVTIVKEGTNTVTVDMDKHAIREFLSDMDYQAECCEDDFQRAYRAQCKRALESVRKQVEGLLI